MSDATYQAKVYIAQGGDVVYVRDGGSIIVESGGTLNCEAGSTVTLSGVTSLGLDSAFDVEPIIDGALSNATAVQIGDGDDHLEIYAVGTAVYIETNGTSNLTIAPDGGTTNVTGALDVSGALTALGVDYGAGSLVGTGDIAINTNKFTVAGATGNTVVAGTLDVTGAATLGSLNISAVQPASGNLEINAATGGNTITIGNLSTGGIVVSDNMTIGVDVLFSTSIGATFRAAGQKIYSSAVEQLDIDATTEVEITTATVHVVTSAAVDIDTAAVDIDASGAVAIDAAGASNFTVAGANLTVSTTGSGSIIITGVALVDVNAGANLDIDVTGTYDMLSSGVFSIDGTGASNVTATSGNLTISTATSGTLILSSAGIVDIDAGGTAAVTINTADDATANATATGSITITAGDKGAGTGDGGNITLIPGDTTGGTAGVVAVAADGAGHDLVWYGATAGDNVTFDASGDDVLVTDIDVFLDDDATLQLGNTAAVPDVTIKSDGTHLDITGGAAADFKLNPKAGAGNVDVAGRITATDGVSGGTAKVVGGRAYSLAAAGSAHTNSTDEAVLASFEIPANTIKANTVVRVAYQGIASVTAGATTLTVRLRLGPTTLTGTALITTTAVDVANDNIFAGEFTLVGRAAPGAAAACIGYSVYSEPGEAPIAMKAGYLASTNFATNGALLAELTADWSAADASSCRADIFNVEIL